eukprot:217726_1
MAVKSLLCALLSSFTFTTFAFNLTWKTEKSIQMPLTVSSQLVCDLNDDTIYFIGGNTTTDNTFTSTNNIYIFNKTNNTFQKSSTTLPNNAYFASNYICNNRTIYMFGAGGNTNAGQLWILNIDTQKITNIPFPTNADQVSLPCTSINEQNNSIYIIGGINNNNSVSNQILQFNFTSNTFINTSYTPMPMKLYGSMCHILNNTDINGTKNSKHGILYVIGGESDTTSNKNIYQYNISSNIWKQIAILKEARSFTKSIYYEKDNFILIIGGGSHINKQFTNTTDVFYIGNYSVIQAFGDELPYEMEFNAVSEHKNKIYVWGGYAMVNGTKKNVKEIVLFDLPGKDKSFTWKTIGLIVGGMILMLCCGGCAYLLCGRSKPDQEDDNAINYRYQK